MDSLPNGFKREINTKEPNEPIVIYQGGFEIRVKEENYNLNGTFTFKWLPSMNVYIEASFSVGFNSLFHFLLVRDEVPKVFVDNFYVGNVILTNIGKDRSKGGGVLKGVFEQFVVLGNSQAEVDEVEFSIPNCKSFLGERIQFENEGSGTRLLLKAEDSIITIDSHPDYENRFNKLKESGGYHTLYSGRLKLNEPKGIERIREILTIVNYHISFFNGRRVGALMVYGLSKGEVLWKDYIPSVNEPYNTVQKWSPANLRSSHISYLFYQLIELCRDPEGLDFLKTAIKWYCEANSPDIAADIRLIVAQTTLDLIYNWWIIEKRGLLSGRDKDNLSASNKIRLILSSIGFNTSIPNDYHELKKAIKGESNNEGPEAIVTVRNALIHSKAENRKKLKNIGDEAQYQALSLALLYIEVALLHILQYKGKYRNRITGDELESIYTPIFKA